MNPFLGRPPLVFAHQGGAREAPSSTLYAIEQAIAAGVTGIELDVHLTLDGVLVVCHDPTLDRTTDGTGAIASRTLEQIRALDAAYWFVPGRGAIHGADEGDYLFRGRAPDDPRFRVAMLSEVLDATAGVVLNLDIKQSAPAVPAYEATLAEALRSAGRTSEVIVASFSDRSVAAFAAAAPEVATAAGAGAITSFVQAVLAGAPPDAAIARHVALQVPDRVAGVRLVDERFVLAAHRLGLAVHIWTIDDAPTVAQLLALGVDGVMSDLPTVALGVANAALNASAGGPSTSPG